MRLIQVIRPRIGPRIAFLSLPLLLLLLHSLRLPVTARAPAQGPAYAALLVGVDGEDLLPDVGQDEGAVHLLPGSAAGLTATGAQFWHQNVVGSVDAVEVGDHFGNALAGGDFNHDGFPDLAVGVYWEDVLGVVDAGAVQVFYGTENGPTAADDQLWHQGVPGIAGALEKGDVFGNALATGDFDGDGFADLAVGAPGEDIGPQVAAGAVTVIYGSAAGLSAGGSQLWDQDSDGVVEQAEAGDRFGYTLAAGDFDGDGFADLAVGVILESVGNVSSAGAVQVLYGSAGGLTATGNQIWHQDSAGVSDTAETGDTFGMGLAAGYFDGDGNADLAIGVYREHLAGSEDAGAVHVLYGSATGLTGEGEQFWNQDSPGIAGGVEASDFFGEALSAGDFDGDGYGDLAIGVPGEGLGTVDNAGAVHVLYGRAGGLAAAGSQLWHQDVGTIVGIAEMTDDFGRALAAGDYDGNGYADLAVGVPFEDLGNPLILGAGSVNVLYGSAAGLDDAGNQLWHQDTPGIADAAEEADEFGVVLGALHPDLAAPTPLAPLSGTVTADPAPSFAWNDETLATRYQLEIATEENIASPLVSTFITGTTFVPAAPLPDGAYWWHVRQQDSVGRWSDWSPSQNFAVDTTTGSAVFLPVVVGGTP